MPKPEFMGTLWHASACQSRQAHRPKSSGHSMQPTAPPTVNLQTHTSLGRKAPRVVGGDVGVPVSNPVRLAAAGTGIKPLGPGIAAPPLHNNTGTGVLTPVRIFVPCSHTTDVLSLDAIACHVNPSHAPRMAPKVYIKTPGRMAHPGESEPVAMRRGGRIPPPILQKGVSSDPSETPPEPPRAPLSPRPAR